jgi:hypothetical protein
MALWQSHHAEATFTAGCRTLLELLRGLLAEVPLQVGEVPLGGS